MKNEIAGYALDSGSATEKALRASRTRECRGNLAASCSALAPAVTHRETQFVGWCWASPNLSQVNTPLG